VKPGLELLEPLIEGPSALVRSRTGGRLLLAQRAELTLDPRFRLASTSTRLRLEPVDLVAHLREPLLDRRRWHDNSPFVDSTTQPSRSALPAGCHTCGLGCHVAEQRLAHSPSFAAQSTVRLR
jgi:hypothetical protein